VSTSKGRTWPECRCWVIPKGLIGLVLLRQGSERMVRLTSTAVTLSALLGLSSAFVPRMPQSARQATRVVSDAFPRA
jgi:hypothetical protein